MSETYEFSGEVVNFPVPKRYLSVVIRALAEAMRHDGVESGIHYDQGSPGQQGRHGGSTPIAWANVENCKALRNSLNHPGALALLDLTAAHPNENLSFEDIVTESKQSKKQVRADLGALTKVIKRLFGVSREDANWPVKVRKAARGEQHTSYMMRPEVALAWKESQNSK
jgi:hypothetical protein